PEIHTRRCCPGAERQRHGHRVDDGRSDCERTRRPDSRRERTGPGQHVYYRAAGDRLMARILIVEDEPSIALALEDDLRREGYETELAEDGEAAERRALSREFDLILLDVMLPKQDGFEVCRRVRRAGVDTPIVLLTAKTQEAEKVVGLEAGADDYV